MNRQSRRKFLQHSTMAAVTPVVSPVLPRLSDWLALGDEPQIHFSADPSERVSVSTYPFRDFIAGKHDQAASAKKMPLKEFPAQVAAKLKAKRIEPWSEHFLSREDAYLKELRKATESAGVGFANIAADGDHSIYAADGEERRKAIAFGINWIDVAVRIGSPSVRLNIAQAKDSKPDAARAAEGLAQIASYAASQKIAVHLENDNPESEDPFFISSLIDRVASPWLHSLPDFGNSLAALPAEQAYKGLDQMFARAYAISHVKDTTTTPGNAVVQVDMPRIFAMAKAHHYKGVFSMEWESVGDVYEGTAKLIATTLKNIS